MRRFDILSPRWRDKRVLLADYKLQEHNKIYFTGKDGRSMGEEPYYISGKRAKSFKRESNGSIDVRSIPLDELKLLELPAHCPHLYN